MRYIVYFFLVAILAIYILLVMQIHDDTDAPGEHSGISLYTDHLTGCQYIGTGLGGLTPRLDNNGKQICK